MTIDEAAQSIRTFFNSHKRIPSYQEMCDLWGFASKKASFEVAKKLIEAGILEKGPKGKLVLKDVSLTLPLLGAIPAGIPGAANEYPLEAVSINDYVVNKPQKSYLLKVIGDSMIDAGIHDGDYVVIEQRLEAKDGDIIVAIIDGQYTLKFYRNSGGVVRLEAANPKYRPFIPDETLIIWGVVISVIRKYH